MQSSRENLVSWHCHVSCYFLFCFHEDCSLLKTVMYMWWWLTCFDTIVVTLNIYPYYHIIYMYWHCIVHCMHFIYNPVLQFQDYCIVSRDKNCWFDWNIEVFYHIAHLMSNRNFTLLTGGQQRLLLYTTYYHWSFIFVFLRVSGFIYFIFPFSPNRQLKCSPTLSILQYCILVLFW